MHLHRLVSGLAKVAVQLVHTSVEVQVLHSSLQTIFVQESPLKLPVVQEQELPELELPLGHQQPVAVLIITHDKYVQEHERHTLPIQPTLPQLQASPFEFTNGLVSIDTHPVTPFSTMAGLQGILQGV